MRPRPPCTSIRTCSPRHTPARTRTISGTRTIRSARTRPTCGSGCWRPPTATASSRSTCTPATSVAAASSRPDLASRPRRRNPLRPRNHPPRRNPPLRRNRLRVRSSSAPESSTASGTGPLMSRPADAVLVERCRVEHGRFQCRPRAARRRRSVPALPRSSSETSAPLAGRLLASTGVRAGVPLALAALLIGFGTAPHSMRPASPALS